MPIIYIDLLFLFNFLMNSLTLNVTSLFLKRNLSLIRLALASGFLALYSVVIFFPGLSFFSSLVAKICAVFLGVLISFPEKSGILILKNALLFFIINSIFAGVMFSLIFFTDFGLFMDAAVSNGEIYLNINASALILSIIPAYLSAFLISLVRKQNERLLPQISDMEISIKNRRVHIKAFSDSGCMLKDPISGFPAVIVSKKTAKKLLSEKTIKTLSGNFSLSDLGDFSTRYRPLPFSTISTHGFLHGFIPDSLLIDNQRVEKVIIGISQNQLSTNHQFDAIYNSIILEDVSMQNEIPNLHQNADNLKRKEDFYVQ